MPANPMESGPGQIVVAGPAYQAGWLHTLLFGEHYRNLWTIPLRVPVLDPATFAGGLTPLDEGGGMQTRLKGSDGRIYTFRSVDKDPSGAFPAAVQEIFAADVLQDQISSSHPAGALVVAALAEAAGLPHANPRLAVMPDDARLGKYRRVFGILEEFPAPAEDGEPAVSSATTIAGSMKLFAALDEDSRERVDASALLAARLLDLLVGDWDRPIGQWRWARRESTNVVRWYPVPRGRGQAFARFDGLFPWLAGLVVPQMESFQHELRNIDHLTFTGRHLDRRLLVDLDKQAWDSVTSAFLCRLTYSAIDSAVRRLPPEMYTEWLSTALKLRRARLAEAAREFYLLLADFVDIRLSNKPEHVSVNRIDDDRVEVSVWQRERQSGAPAGEPVFHRVFQRDETKEIRLYLLGGDDRVVVRGDVSGSIDVRVVGGKGDDELVDKSCVRGRILLFLPAVRTRTFFYDHEGNNTIVAGRSCAVDRTTYTPPAPGQAQYE